MKLNFVLPIILMLFYMNTLDGQILSSPKPIEPFEIGQIMQKKLFDEDIEYIAPTLTDVELWSNIISTDSLLEIVYKPENFNGDLLERDEGDELDYTSNEFKLAKDIVIQLVQKNNRTLKDRSIIIDEDDEDPVVVLKIDSYESVYWLRKSSNVHFLGLGGLMNEKYEEDIQNGNYTLPIRNELYLDGLFSGGNPNTDDKNKLLFPWWFFEYLYQYEGCGDAITQTPNVDTEDGGFERVPWHYAEMGISQANHCSAGAGVKIALLDTGVGVNQPRLGANFDYNFPERFIKKITTYSSGVTSDLCGHGNAMAGVIAGPKYDHAVRGAAYESNLISIRSNKDPLILSIIAKKNIKKALKTVRKGWYGTVNTKIISMSFGMIYGNWRINRQIRKLDKADVLMFGAVGTSNFGPELRKFQVHPARNKRVVGVTGVYKGFPENPRECDRCHYGGSVKFVVPMQYDEDNLTHSLSLVNTPAKTRIGGSSIATATMAGVAAMIWALPENVNKSDEEIVDIMRLASTSPDSQWNKYGHGVVDVAKALGCNAEIISHLQHENGEPDSFFACGEDIILNTTGSIYNYEGHFLRLNLMENGEIVGDAIVETAWNGPFPGTLPILNISEIFANEEEEVIYDAGQTYQLTFGIKDANLGWIYVKHEFTLLQDDDKVVKYQLERVDGSVPIGNQFIICEDIYVNSSETDLDYSGHFFRLNCIENGAVVHPAIVQTTWHPPFPGNPPIFNLSEIFENEEEEFEYEVGKSYRLQMGILDTYCGWIYEDNVNEGTVFTIVEDNKVVEYQLERENGTIPDNNQFSICEDIYVNSSETDLDYSGHFFRLNCIENGEVVHPAIVQTTWHPPFPGNPPIFNLTEIFENEEEVFEYEVGKSYRLQMGILDTYCGWIYEENVNEGTIITIVDEFPSLAEGSISYWCSDNPVKDVTVDVSGQPNCTYLTEGDGLYDCSNTLNFTITPTKDINPTNGISTLDLSVLLQHLNGNIPFEDPFQFIAADVNNSQTITQEDFDVIADIVLSLSNEFPDNTSWRFHDASAPIDIDDPFSGLKEFIDSEYCREDYDFKGIKIGDLNCTAEAQLIAGGSGNRIAHLPNDPRATYNKGDRITIPLSFLESKRLLGLQFGIEYDTNVLSYSGFNNKMLTGLNERNFNDKLEGEFRLYWLANDPQNSQLITQGNEFAEFTFVVNKPFSDISQYLFLQGLPDLKSEIYLDDLSTQSLEFKNSTTDGRINWGDNENLLDLEQSNSTNNWLTVYPNPVRNSLFFLTDKEELSEVSLLNSKMQIIKVLNKSDLETGKIDLSAISPGIYFLKFTNIKKETIIKKVVRMN